MKIAGGCLCGAVRYEGEVEEPRSMSCYCKDCQKATGSACASFVAVPEPALKITGDCLSFAKRGESGRTVTRSACASCGSQLYSQVEVMPGVYFVKLGTLDDSSSIAPQMAIWTDSKPSWAHLGEIGASFGKNPPMG